MNDNVINLNPSVPASVKCTCLNCAHCFETKIEPGELDGVTCPVCNTAKTVPFTLVAPPDDIEVYICECGNDLFRDLGEGTLQCAKCGEITDPVEE